MAERKIPMRKCIGCNEMKPKNQLLRVVRDPDGVISVDSGGKKSGRGAYICRDRACFALAKKSSRLEKAFECRVEPGLYDELAKAVDDEQ